MISVQNLQRLLSGSKIIVLVLLIGFLGSCGTAEKATSRSTTKTRSSFPPKKKRNVAKVDTIAWKEVDITDKKNKTTDNTNSETNLQDHYDVALLIPLEAKSYTAGKSTERMINYYAGVKMALEQLGDNGANITLHTIDVADGGSITTKLREATSVGADVIIGPYDKDDLKAAAKFAKDEEITLVSPWYSSSKTTEDNPYFIQLKPSLLDHYQKMMEHVSKNYDLDQVVLLAQEGNRTDENRAKYFQKLARSYFKENTAKPLQEYFISQDSLNESRMLFYEYLQPEKTTVFLLPNMNSTDESFIYGAIRRLTAERGDSKVVVYGMPIVLDSEKLTFDNYYGTSAHVVASNFVDKEDSKVLAFKRKYYDLYGGIPSEEAYEGYDMMLYIGNAIMKYGTSFQYKMNQDYKDLLQTNIALYPSYQDSDDNYSSNKKIDYFANKNVEVISFKDNKFKRLD